MHTYMHIYTHIPMYKTLHVLYILSIQTHTYVVIYMTHVYNKKPFNLASNLISMSYKYQKLFFLNPFHEDSCAQIKM